MFAASWWIAPTRLILEAAHSCPPLSTSSRYPLGQVCGSWSFFRFSSFATTRVTRRAREGGREVRRHRFKSQTIGKQSFSNDYPFREEGNNFWKFSFFSLENACRSWWKISVVELLTSVVLVRGEGSWSSVSVELYVASSRRTNLSLPRSFNQLTGNYREINHFCASLHEPLDDVAKSQATRLVYISSTAGGCLRFPRETRGNYSRKSKERRGCELSSSCSLPGRNSPGMRWTDSWH